MTREEAIHEWTFRSNHIKKWLDEYGEEPSIRHYVELIDMAIEALTFEEYGLTCKTCADRNMCIMSAPDGQWKACEDYRPSTDEVSVVRCKDCKWWNTETYGCNRNPCVEQWHEDDFCNYGERREE